MPQRACFQLVTQLWVCAGRRICMWFMAKVYLFELTHQRCDQTANALAKKGQFGAALVTLTPMFESP